MQRQSQNTQQQIPNNYYHPYQNRNRGDWRNNNMENNRIRYLNRPQTRFQRFSPMLPQSQLNNQRDRKGLKEAYVKKFGQPQSSCQIC